MDEKLIEWGITQPWMYGMIAIKVYEETLGKVN